MRKSESSPDDGVEVEEANEGFVAVAEAGDEAEKFVKERSDRRGVLRIDVGEVWL